MYKAYKIKNNKAFDYLAKYDFKIFSNVYN